MLEWPTATVILGILGTICVAIIKMRRAPADDGMIEAQHRALRDRVLVLETNQTNDRETRVKFEEQITAWMKSLEKKMDILIEKLP